MAHLSSQTHTKMPRTPTKPLQKFMFDDAGILEVGIDEAGRGPLFGRVYAAAVVLPKDSSFPHELMKDSKKFSSQKRLAEVAQIIMEKATVYSVKYAESTEIDALNPLKATMKIMNDCVSEIIDKLSSQEGGITSIPMLHLLVDGSYFRPRARLTKDGRHTVTSIPYTCVTSGDDTFTSIAAASILAKFHRDAYVDGLCDAFEGLDELYGLRKNKGYGTATHLAAIKQYGITKWHRKTFGICKNASVIEIEVTQE